MTSSPFPTPAAKYAAWSAAVPELRATANFAPTFFATAFSNAATAGPWVSHGERNVLATALTSALVTSCVEYGIIYEAARDFLMRCTIWRRALGGIRLAVISLEK